LISNANYKEKISNNNRESFTSKVSHHELIIQCKTGHPNTLKSFAFEDEDESTEYYKYENFLNK
jgi:hypothetical protein